MYKMISFILRVICEEFLLVFLALSSLFSFTCEKSIFTLKLRCYERMTVLLYMLTFSVKDTKIKIKLSKKDFHRSQDHNCSPTSNDQAICPKVRTAMEWDVSTVSLKPRVFCLEHAIEVEELLSSRGGANVLAICHSGR